MLSDLIVQESLELTRVLIVPEGAMSPAADQHIRDSFRARLGKTVDVEVERVTEIPPERSGKFRYVVSRVDPQRMGASPA